MVGQSRSEEREGSDKVLRRQAGEAMADYLQTLKWDAYFTSTFAEHQRYSQTAMERTVRALSVGERPVPRKMFVCAEQHLLGGWHCHGLLDFPNEALWKDFLEEGARHDLARLGFNVVSEIRGKEAVTLYCAKYLTKTEKEGDWLMTGKKEFWQRA